MSASGPERPPRQNVGADDHWLLDDVVFVPRERPRLLEQRSGCRAFQCHAGARRRRCLDINRVGDAGLRARDSAKALDALRVLLGLPSRAVMVRRQRIGQSGNLSTSGRLARRWSRPTCRLSRCSLDNANTKGLYVTATSLHAAGRGPFRVPDPVSSGCASEESELIEIPS